MNLKKAKKLRKLIGVIVHSRREYEDGHGDRHRFPVDGLMTVGAMFKKRLVTWRFPRSPGTITLAKESHRAAYQRIKRNGIIDHVLDAKVM